MNSIDEPATGTQIKYLRDHGYQPNDSLTKAEAAQLIRDIGDQLQHHSDVAHGLPPEPVGGGPYHFRRLIETAQRALAVARGGDVKDAERLVAMARAQRVEFWLDTCREATEFHVGSSAVRELYRQHGCLFCTPTQKQAQDVLEALDSALPLWDRDHPELFYQTMRLNFPELVRHF